MPNHGEHHDNENHGVIFDQVKCQKSDKCTYNRSAYPVQITLFGNTESRFHDRDNGQQNPVTMSDTQK